MKTTTAREFLVGQGLAKPGRGKFSNVAKEALAKAIEAGTEFSDYTIKGSSAKVEETSYETAPMTWPNGTARFVETGKKVSMSSACNSCGYSLSWCECPSPRVYSKAVTISPK
jgi:hypothetical protein